MSLRGSFGNSGRSANTVGSKSQICFADIQSMAICECGSNRFLQVRICDLQTQCFCKQANSKFCC
jgi:hypothetical protein